MKTLEELKQQQSIFLDLFKDGKEPIAHEFDIDVERLDNIYILYAYYSYEDYSGDAYLLFIENNKIYEVDAGHCSCHGLEGQFKPEEVPIEVLYYRLNNKKWNWYHLEEVL